MSMGGAADRLLANPTLELENAVADRRRRVDDDVGVVEQRQRIVVEIAQQPHSIDTSAGTSSRKRRPALALAGRFEEIDAGDIGRGTQDCDVHICESAVPDCNPTQP